MNKQILNKYLPIGILILLAVIVTFGLRFNFPTTKNSTPGPSVTVLSNEAELKVYLPNDGSRIFIGAVTKTTTFADILYFVSLKNVDLKYSISKTGSFTLISFMGFADTPFKNWHFYINGKLINSADINKTVVKGGSFIEARFE